MVIPSMPGYGFSGKPTATGWDPDHIARAWAELMKRLGYTRYVAQGGDWGAPISSAMARQAPAGLLGIHINLPATVPPEVAAALAGGGPVPAGLSEKERAVFDALMTYAKKGNSAYFVMMTARPQTDRLRRDRLPGRSSRRGFSCIPASRSGRTAPIPKSRRRKTTCWTTSRCTG